MSAGIFNQDLLEKIRKSIRENKDSDKFDWFIIGFLYAQPNHSKTLGDLVKSQKSISLLYKNDIMSPEDSDELLLKMINKSIQTKDSSNGDSKNNEQKLDKDDLSEDMSYKSAGTENLSDNGSDLDKPRKNVAIRKKLEQNPDSGEWKFGYLKKNPEDVVIPEKKPSSSLKRMSTREEEELSIALIKQLEEEENSMVNERKKKEDETNAEINCGICLCSLYEEAFVPLENCKDINFPIKCPSGCGNEVSRLDMQQVLAKDLLAKFDEYSLQKYVDTHADEISCCPTADCKYAFMRDDEKDDDVLDCPLCKKKYCLNCRVDFHKGMTCKEYKISNSRDANDLKFEKFVKGKKFKQCAKCKFWVEKNKGCDHMVCRCKYEFCYKCGGKFRECECVQKQKEQIERQRQLMAARALKNKKRRK